MERDGSKIENLPWNFFKKKKKNLGQGIRKD